MQRFYKGRTCGVELGSYFQPFVGKRDLKRWQGEDTLRRPEMVKGYLDIWELGLHS